MSFDDEMRRLREAQESMNTRLDHLVNFLMGTQGYTPPPYAKPMTEAACKKIGGTWDPDTGKCTLTQSVVVAAVPTTKEACEKAGGKWEDGKCVMPEEATEAARGILPTGGVLPSSTPIISSDEAKASEIIKRIKGE